MVLIYRSIIGGGTAGLTVAARLSEDPGVSVLVLEAGADHSQDLNVLVPGLFPAMYGNPDYDWDYKTVPQVNLSRSQSVSSIDSSSLLPIIRSWLMSEVNSWEAPAP